MFLLFRDFGFGKSSMEELIHEEILNFNQQLDRELDQPIDVKHKFNIAVVNGLMSIMTGKRYDLVSEIVNHSILSTVIIGLLSS